MPSPTGVDIDRRLLGLQQDGGRVRLLERDVFQVNALDLKYGVVVGSGFSHGDESF
jgi:hypothetical protein